MPRGPNALNAICLPSAGDQVRAYSAPSVPGGLCFRPRYHHGRKPSCLTLELPAQRRCGEWSQTGTHSDCSLPGVCTWLCQPGHRVHSCSWVVPTHRIGDHTWIVTVVSPVRPTRCPVSVAAGARLRRPLGRHGVIQVCMKIRGPGGVGRSCVTRMCSISRSMNKAEGKEISFSFVLLCYTHAYTHTHPHKHRVCTNVQVSFFVW